MTQLPLSDATRVPPPRARFANPLTAIPEPLVQRSPAPTTAGYPAPPVATRVPSRVRSGLHVASRSPVGTGDPTPPKELKNTEASLNTPSLPFVTPIRENAPHHSPDHDAPRSLTSTHSEQTRSPPDGQAPLLRQHSLQEPGDYKTISTSGTTLLAAISNIQPPRSPQEKQPP